MIHGRRIGREAVADIDALRTGGVVDADGMIVCPVGRVAQGDLAHRDQQARPGPSIFDLAAVGKRLAEGRGLWGDGGGH